MPELPEVETTRRGIAPHIKGQRVTEFIVRQSKLRWPVPVELHETLPGRTVLSVERRAKYLLIQFDVGCLLVHLGMSGSLRLVTQDAEVGKHDHVDICFSTGIALRLTDPRRFGSVLWQPAGVEHKLLKNLGPEPLSSSFCAEQLLVCAVKRRSAVKTFIMDNKVVVGVGNIYANEALFHAAIHPQQPANTLTDEQALHLTEEIKAVLAKAIAQGGTTLKDFVGGDGKPGYFAQELSVYGRAGLPCVQCGTLLSEIRLGQRSTVFCSQCQC